MPRKSLPAFFKNDLAYKLTIHPSDPGAFHLHSNDRDELEAYAREMCAEVYDDEAQAWVNPRGRANHYWDCEVMCKALAYILGVRNIKHPSQRKPRKKEAIRGEQGSLAGRLGEYRR